MNVAVRSIIDSQGTQKSCFPLATRPWHVEPDVNKRTDHIAHSEPDKTEVRGACKDQRGFFRTQIGSGPKSGEGPCDSSSPRRENSDHLGQSSIGTVLPSDLALQLAGSFGQEMQKRNLAGSA